ncbi:MAG: replication initiation protein [Brevinematales bacterium]|jgi:plasmid replication initiation protein
MPVKKEPEKFMVVAKNEAMRSKMPYSLEEQKLAGVIISRVHPFKNKGFQEMDFETKVLLGLLRIHENNYKYLYTATEGLLKKPITIRNEENGTTLQANIISSALYSDDKSVVVFSIDPKMSPYLLELQKGGYTQFYLTNILGLESKYSISMYRFLKSFEFQKCVTKSIEEFKFSLGIEPDEYKNFAHLKMRVLDVAQQELAEKTDVRFKYTPGKKGKKVISLTFTINWNPDNITRLNQLKTVISLKEKDLAENKKELEKVKAQGKSAPALSRDGLTPEQIHEEVIKSLKIKADGELPL